MALNDYEIVLKAAADPARVRILKLLGGRELCVYQLMELLALSQSTISGHLSLLKKAGLVNDRRDGRWVHYSLCDKKRNQYAPVSYTHLRAHETKANLVCRLLLA